MVYSERFLLTCMVMLILSSPIFIDFVSAWSDGGYGEDPSNQITATTTEPRRTPWTNFPDTSNNAPSRTSRPISMERSFQITMYWRIESGTRGYTTSTMTLKARWSMTRLRLGQRYISESPGISEDGELRQGRRVYRYFKHT